MVDNYAPPDKQKQQVKSVPFAPAERILTAPVQEKVISSKAYLDAVSRERLRDAVDRLSAFPTRHTRSLHLFAAADWIVSQFQTMGYADVKKMNYSEDGLDLVNIICTKSAAGLQAGTILVGAHYDSRMEDLENSTARAPGANDNATGVAVILELARVLASAELEQTIQFACFSGEEQGLWGSTALARHIQASDTNLQFVINLDQIGYPNAARELLVERDEGNHKTSNDGPSHALASRIAQLAHDNALGPVRIGPIYDSDYMPFEARGYVVVGFYETGKYPAYHSTNDTSEKIDYDYLANMAKAVMLAVTCAGAS